MKTLLQLLLILVFSVSCNPKNPIRESLKSDHSVVNSTVIDKIITDSIELELGEISKNLQLVRLESSESVLLGNIYSIVLGDNQIVIGTERDYYLFDRNGKFIRRLFNRGRGPEEFINPLFSQIIKNDILYISDDIKSKKYIYTQNLRNGIQNTILRTNEDRILSFLPDTDTTLVIVTENMFRDNKSNLTLTFKYSLIKQDFKGKLLYDKPLGTFKVTGSLSTYGGDLFISNNDILISGPRCDSIFQLTNDKLIPIWRNLYTTNFDDRQSTQKVPEAHLVYYSNDTLLFLKSTKEYTAKRISSGKDQFLLMDRVNDKLIAIKRLYFKNRSNLINIARINRLNNDQFALVFQATDIDRMLKDPLLNETIERIMSPDSTDLTKTVSIFDNPFILIGRFN